MDNVRGQMYAFGMVSLLITMVVLAAETPQDGLISRTEAAQITGLSPMSQRVCNCIPEDISRSLEKMALATELLADQLTVTEMREADAQAALAEARAEIERLKVENGECRELTKILGDTIRLSKPTDSGWPSSFPTVSHRE